MKYFITVLLRHMHRNIAGTSSVPASLCQHTHCANICLLLQGLRLEMGAALAAGHADLEGREAAVKEAERRLTQQQVRGSDATGRTTLPVSQPTTSCPVRWQLFSTAV
jgi:hypothetical protein